MDYSLLLAVHNINEEVKCTQKISHSPSSMLSSSKCASSSDVMPAASPSIHEDMGTITSTDSGIAMSIVPNLPTYIQYLRVIQFIRAQQIPSLRASSISNADQSLSSDHANDNSETASIKTVKLEISPVLPGNQSSHVDTQPILRTNSKSPINSTDTASPFHLTNALIGGDVWYNRQNLSRLAMYVNIQFFFR
jgi:hypothetical protein